METTDYRQQEIKLELFPFWKQFKNNMQKMHNANSDKPVAFYSSDVILSVGYSANSKVAIAFRK